MVFKVERVEEGSIPEGLLNLQAYLHSASKAGDWSLAQSVSNLITRKDACNKVLPVGKLLNKHKLLQQINT